MPRSAGQRHRHAGERELPTLESALEAGLGDLHGELVHWQYDTFLAKWYDRSLRGDAFITFTLDQNGKIEQAKMKPYSPAVDFSFDYQDLILTPVND